MIVDAEKQVNLVTQYEGILSIFDAEKQVNLVTQYEGILSIVDAEKQVNLVTHSMREFFRFLTPRSKLTW